MPWTFNDPFFNPVSTTGLLRQLEDPEGDKDPWKIILEQQLTLRNARCDRWKAEIENLLVFAGLFSAVVTTFVVDSYKNINPNPQDTTVLLLAQLVSQLAPRYNNSIPTAPIPPATPDLSQVRVNTLWFLSLVLALGTAVGGITVLQWIRSFQQYDPNLTSKQAFALASLRERSLNNWNLSTFIAALPFILQLALVLFLIGLSDFLFNNVSQPVAIPCIAASAIIIAFLVTSIMLPTIQYAFLRLGMFKRSVPTPSPYRSPAGWACFRLMRWLGTTTGLYNIIHRLLSSLRPGTAGDGRQRRDARRFRASVKREKEDEDHDFDEDSSDLEWVQMDMNWLFSRNKARSHARSAGQNQENPTRLLQPHDHDGIDDSGLMYDAMNGLLLMQDYLLRSSGTPYTLYKCFRDLPPHLVKDTWTSAPNHALGGGPTLRASMLFDYPESGERMKIQISDAEDDMISLEGLVQAQRRGSHGRSLIVTRQLEICVRYLGAIFQHSPESPFVKDGARLESGPGALWRIKMWLPGALFELRDGSPYGDWKVDNEIQDQLSFVLSWFVYTCRANRPLEMINVSHTLGQITSLVRAVTGTFSAERANDSISINKEFTEFLTEEFAASINDPVSDTVEHGRTALYLTCTMYIYDMQFLHESLFRPDTSASLADSVVELTKAWLTTGDILGFDRLDRMGLFEDTSFFAKLAENLRSLLGDAAPASTRRVAEPDDRHAPQRPGRRSTLISVFGRGVGREGSEEAGQREGGSTGDTVASVV